MIGHLPTAYHKRFSHQLAKGNLKWVIECRWRRVTSVLPLTPIKSHPVIKKQYFIFLCTLLLS